MESCKPFLCKDHKRYPVRSKKATKYSPHGGEFFEEEEKTDDIALGKTLKVKQRIVEVFLL